SLLELILKACYEQSKDSDDHRSIDTLDTGLPGQCGASASARSQFNAGGCPHLRPEPHLSTWIHQDRAPGATKPEKTRSTRTITFPHANPANMRSITSSVWSSAARTPSAISGRNPTRPNRSMRMSKTG